MQAFDAKIIISDDQHAATKACLCAVCLGCIGAGWNRSNIRKRHTIESSFIVDCLAHLFCGVCAVTQEWQHVMGEKHKNPRLTICNLPK
jgi:Cys-rich protein (TIGR01571 family)